MNLKKINWKKAFTFQFEDDNWMKMIGLIILYAVIVIPVFFGMFYGMWGGIDSMFGTSTNSDISWSLIVIYLIISALLFMFFIYGYVITFAKQLLTNNTKLPEINFKPIKPGIRYVGYTIVFSLILFLVLIVLQVFLAIFGIDLSNLGYYGYYYGPSIIEILIVIALYIFFYGVLVTSNYIYLKTNSINHALNFSVLWTYLYNNWKRLLLTLGVYIIVMGTYMFALNVIPFLLYELSYQTPIIGEILGNWFSIIIIITLYIFSIVYLMFTVLYLFIEILKDTDIKDLKLKK